MLLRPIHQQLSYAACLWGLMLFAPVPTMQAQDPVRDLLKIDYVDLSGRGRVKGNRKAAGSRNLCEPVKSNETIMALVPETNFGITVSPNPIFWFHMPYQAHEFQSIKFILRNQQSDIVYEQVLLAADIATEGELGIIGLKAPQDGTPLVIDQDYTWTFIVYCDVNATSAGNGSIETRGFVRGTVRRASISLQLTRALDRSDSPQAQAQAYAQNGIWHEALTQLSMLPASPSRASYLVDLLEDVGLEPLATKTWADCCTK